MIIQGSLHAIRAIGIAPPAIVAWNIDTIARSSLIPCWRSTQT